MANRYWVGGTGSWAATTTNWSATSGGAGGASVPTLSDDVFFDTLSNATLYTVTLTTAPVCRSVTIGAPLTGAVTIAGSAAWSIYGSLTIAATGVTRTFTSALTFAATTTGFTITTNGVALASAITLNGAGGGWTLGSALTNTAGFTLTNGALNIGNNNLTCVSFASNNTNSRSITFGTAAIYLTGNAVTIWNTDTGTNLSYTGSPNVYCTYSGSTGTRAIQGTANATATETNVFNFFVNAGSDSFTVLGARRYRTLDFTGFSGTLTAWATNMGIYGDFVASSTMTITPNTISLVFLATLITQKITTNGKTLSFPVNANNNNLQLQDAVAIDPAYTFTLASGTLDLNAKTLTSGTFSSTGSSVRSIAFNGGTIVTSGATFTASGSNFTTTGTGTISMTSASSKTFAGGGFSYPTLNQGGAGALVLTGANTFQNITNTVQPATVTLPAGSTTYVANFGLLGTAGNLITLNSSTSGTQAAISNTSGGFIGGNYLSLKDTNATPANTMYAGRNTTSVSNNTGWVFTNLFVDSVAETSTFTTAEASQIDFVPAIAESLTTTESQSVRMDWNNLTVESFSSTDAVSAIAVYVPTVSETVALSDSQIQRGWIKINDNQTPGWVRIDNYQG